MGVGVGVGVCVGVCVFVFVMDFVNLAINMQIHEKGRDTVGDNATSQAQQTHSHNITSVPFDRLLSYEEIIDALKFKKSIYGVKTLAIYDSLSNLNVRT